MWCWELNMGTECARQTSKPLPYRQSYTHLFPSPCLSHRITVRQVYKYIVRIFIFMWKFYSL